MYNLQSRAFGTLASMMALGLAACSTAGDGASRISAPSAAARAAGPVAEQTGTVCKSGPLGTYSFTASAGGSANTGDVLIASPFTLSVTTAGVAACTKVFSRTQSTGESDAPAVITVVEGASATTTLSSITVVVSDNGLPSSTNLTTRTATFGVNAYHNSTATFVNAALHVAGCTYTQGWYKNHTTKWPSGFAPTNTFDGWGTYIDLYNTPPKGSQYIILAHQYMTALMNLASGATPTPAVTAAMAQAKAYFDSSSLKGVGTTNITGVSDILDEFNNGNAAGGPAHCE
jgi:hypothetical protein